MSLIQALFFAGKQKSACKFPLTIWVETYRRFRHSAQFQPLNFCYIKGSNPPKIFFVTILNNKKTPAINSSLKRRQSQVLYAYCTKKRQKVLQTGVHIHFPSKNIYGDDYLFPRRFMPASGSVKPFAGIISFWSHKAGSPDWTWTSDTLINSQVLLPTELRRNIETQQVWNLLCLLSVGTYLSSRVVARQVFSTQTSLTSVFGMGTGGPSPPSAPTIKFTFGEREIFWKFIWITKLKT